MSWVGKEITVNTRIALFTALALPALAVAQGGGSDRIPRRGTAPPDYDRLVAGASAPTQLTARDMEGISPVKHLLDKKKELGLTDDQVKRIKELDDSLKARNAPHFRDLDSLRKEMKPSDAVPEVERIRMRGVRRSLVGVVTSVRANYDAVEPDALALLTEDQRKSAEPMLEKERDEADEMLKKKLGGGRRGS